MVESPVAATPTMPAEQTHGHVPERRPWSRPWVWATAAVVTLSLIAGAFVAAVGPFRHAGPHRNTVAATTPSVTTHGSPLGAQFASYHQDVAALDRASGTAASAFAALGHAPAAGDLVAPASAYRTALSRYESQLHRLSWPTSIQNLVEIDETQMQAFVAFLSSAGSVHSGAVPAWLTELGNRAGTARAADAALRQELGVPATATIP